MRPLDKRRDDGHARVKGDEPDPGLSLAQFPVEAPCPFWKDKQEMSPLQLPDRLPEGAPVVLSPRSKSA